MNILSNFSAGNSAFGMQDTGETQKKLSQANSLVAPKQANANLDVSRAQEGSEDRNQPTTKEAFSDFVGQTFFGQLISSMRSTVSKPAYFHGGRAEEVFQGQLDQMLTENMSKASSKEFAEPMYDLFMLQRN